MNRYDWVRNIILIFYLTLSQGILAQQHSQHSDSNNSRVSVYLTFDDGPFPASYYLLKLTRTDSIPITVFLIGKYVFSTLELRSLYQSYLSDSLIEIGNHSYSHANKKYKAYYEHPQQVVSDIILNEKTLGLTNKIARLPGRNAWRIGNRKRDDLPDVSAAGDSLANRGFTIIGWDLAWMYDSNGKSDATSEQMISYVRQLIRNDKTFTPAHIVILCHDPMLQNEYSRLQIGLFIKSIKAEAGWQFRHLSEYPEDISPDDFFHQPK